jgi:hypothetical protein
LQPGQLRPQRRRLCIKCRQLVMVSLHVVALGDCPERTHGRRVYFRQSDRN